MFAGIFATMIPALAILRTHGDELGLTQTWQYFWLSGGLSSFLDNAPTYLTFTAVAQGFLGAPHLSGLMSSAVVAGGAVPAAYLAAVSCGSVFMGANSYIGNAPNFMVKSIAEEHGVRAQFLRLHAVFGSGARARVPGRHVAVLQMTGRPGNHYI